MLIAAPDVMRAQLTLYRVMLTVNIWMTMHRLELALSRTAGKSENGVTALSRLVANVTGLKSSKRHVLISAVQSALLYGVDVWTDAVDKKVYRK